MKRYMNFMLVALLASCGLPTHFACGVPVEIAPIGDGDNSIVDAIKYYSNLTEADVNQRKLLWLGQQDMFGAFALGFISAAGAGIGIYEYAPQYSETIKSWTPEKMANMKDWVSSPAVLAGVGSVGAGYLSYKFLYPRIRAGVFNKVDKFISVCEGLEEDTANYQQHADNDGQMVKSTIFNRQFNNLEALKNVLPEAWPSDNNIAVYIALNNLVEQGRRALFLLNAIGLKDSMAQQQRKLLNYYYKGALVHNRDLYNSVIDEKKRQEIQDAELENLKAQKNLAVAGKYALYGSMLKGSVSGVWSGIKQLYKHPEILALFGLAWVTRDYLIPSTKAAK